MSIDLREIRTYLLSPKLEDRKLASLLEKIKVMYTIDRKGLSSKKWTRDEVSAYTAFYLTTNVVKFEWIMNQLSSELKAELSQCDVVDFGTGPGTYLLAFMRYFEKIQGTMIGVDKEDLMLEQAHRLLGGLFPATSFDFMKEIPEEKSSRKKLLIFGNSCNELSTRDINQVIEKVNADYILFIEPGTPLVYDQMMELRSGFKKKKFSCLYPCPSIDLDCPVKKKVDGGEDDWCHQVWRGTHNPSIERLGQLAKIDRKVMPMIIHMYANTMVKPSVTTSARFIRYLNESKYAFTWEVCLLEEGKLRLCLFEIMKKSLEKKEMKSFKKLSVGENFSFEVVKVLDNEHYRVKVEI